MSDSVVSTKPMSDQNGPELRCLGGTNCARPATVAVMLATEWLPVCDQHREEYAFFTHRTLSLADWFERGAPHRPTWGPG